MPKEINLDDYEPIGEQERQPYIKGIDLNEYEPIVEKPVSGEEPPIEKEDSGILTEAYKAFIKNFLEVPKGVGAIAERAGEAIGSERIRQFGETLRKAMGELEAGELPLDYGFYTVKPRSVEPDIQSLSDIKSTRDALKFITSQIGQMGGFIAQQFLVPGGGVLGGTAGKGVIGKAIQLAKPNIGEIPIAIAEAGQVLESTKERKEEAEAAGVPFEEPSIIRQLIGIGTATKLERLGLEYVMGRLGLGPEAAKNLSKGFLRRIGEGALIGAGAEGAEEFLQNYPETWGAGGDIKELFSLKTLKSGIEQAVGAAIGGGFFGGLGGAVAKRANYAQRKEIEEYINNPDVPIESRLNAIEAIRELVSTEDDEVANQWYEYAKSRLLNIEDTPEGGKTWNPLPIDITTIQPIDKLGIEIERQMSLLDQETGGTVQQADEVAKAGPTITEPITTPTITAPTPTRVEEPVTKAAKVEEPVKVEKPVTKKPEEARIKPEEKPVTKPEEKVEVTEHPVTPGKYYINLEGEFKEVKGKKVIIPGFEKYDLFAHKEGKEWIITEGKTGLRVGPTAPTLDKLKENAKTTLDQYKNVLDETINKSLEKAISPRWAKPAVIEEAPAEKPAKIEPEMRQVEEKEVEPAITPKAEEKPAPEIVEEKEPEKIAEKFTPDKVWGMKQEEFRKKWDDMLKATEGQEGEEKADIRRQPLYNQIEKLIEEFKEKIRKANIKLNKKEETDITDIRFLSTIFERNKEVQRGKTIEKIGDEIIEEYKEKEEKKAKEVAKPEKVTEEKPEVAEKPEKPALREGQAETPIKEKEAALPSSKTASVKIADWVQDKLSKGEKIDKLSLFKKAEEEYGGKRTEGKFASKDAFDAMELGINKYIETMKLSGTPTENLETIKTKIMDKIPSQAGLRSEEQEEFQQFSTPPTLAYLMTWVANINKNDVVVEPSAGVGGIAVFAKKEGAEVVVNELSKRRVELLKKMDFDAVYSVNAEQLNNMLPYHVKPTVIVMNPPFSATAGRIKGQKSTFNIIKHISSALKRLEPDGRLVLLTGKDWRGESKILNDYLKQIQQEGNTILADISISGKGYEKYGTTYDTRMFVIDKAKKDVTMIKESVDDVKDAIPLLEGVRNERISAREREPIKPEGEEIHEGHIGRPTVLPPTGERVSGQTPVTGRPGYNVGGVIRGGAEEGVEVSGEPGRGGERGLLGERGKQGEVREGGEHEGRLSGVNIGENERPNADNLVIAKEAEEEYPAEDLTQQATIFEPYKPSIEVEGAKEHPTLLEESAAMAAIKMPKLTYKAQIGNIVKEGKISIAQYEPVAYAGQAHSKMLGDGKTRQGYFCGDGCVAGETRIYDPEKGTHTTIKELAQIGESITVLSLTKNGFIKTKANAPFLKGEDDLYEIKLKSGRLITVTSNHKFLTPYGWKRIVDGLNVGHFVASVEGHPANSLGFYPSTHAEDVPCWFKKPEDCLDYCSDENNQYNKEYHSRWDKIVSIKFVRHDVFYDMFVPGTENYVAEGIIHHNTGVGKGRTIAAVMLDNWNQGRKKHVWVSKNFKLIKDAARDCNAIGFQAKLINLSDIKVKEKIPDKEGIAFISYDTLANNKGGSRLNQIVEWLGQDFDGVIALDEAHLVGNAIDGKELGLQGKAAQRALVTVDLQKKLPKARVLYASATGATEVANLSFAERLGLWGEGTPFAKKVNFIKNIVSGGIVAMEMIAQSLKNSGLYISRALSFKGVKYETLTHKLSADQIDIYNELARAWRIVYKNLDEALGITGASSREKANAIKNLWSTNQRFFNQIITSMQTPSLLTSIEQDLKNGHSAIVQLVNTNEASLNRATAEHLKEEELSSIDITPRDQLIGFIRNGFPVIQKEEYKDEDGNTRTRPVLDENGRPVLNREAVAIRDRLIQNLKDIRVPMGALDMIITHFGADMVAEVTGRTKRLVTYYENGEKKYKLQSWSETKSLKDVDDFQDGKKRILVFSDAGGTGASYHADLGVKNQQLRRHYLLQPGWRANIAIQGLGRSHRANEKQPPEFILVTTNIMGQKRFISSIARRLEQLGALTKGQRETAGQGMFSAQDNLETLQAQAALRNMIQDIYTGKFDKMDIGTLEDQTGLRLVDDYGHLLKELPDMTKFMNRILAMEVNMQNILFDYYEQHHKEAIEHAIKNGTLDAGLETIKAKKAEKIKEEVVYDKDGKIVKYVEIAITTDFISRPFEESEQRAKAGYYKNIKSGQVWAASDVFQKTITKTGEVVKIHELIGPRNIIHDVEQEDLLNPEKYQKVDKNTAKELWDKEYQALPKEITRMEPMIIGNLLSIWDRLPNDKVRLVRVKLSSGEKLIGRLIPHEQLEKVLRSIGATSTSLEYSPKQLLDILLGGGKLELANRWEIERVQVSGEPKILIGGYTVESFGDMLKSYGAYTEKVGWTTRYYIPTNEKGAEVLEKIINKISPVLRVIEETKYHAPAFATYRMVKKPTGVKAGDLNRFLQPKLEKLSKNIDTKISIIQSNYDLPEDFIKRAKGFDRDIDIISGAYDWKTDTLYVISNAIDSPLMAENIIIQELVGHKGLPAILKPLELNMIRNSIYDQFKGTKEMEKVIDSYKLDTSSLKGRLKAGDEYMVHHMPDIYDAPSIMQRITAFIRRALRKMGFAINYNETDIQFLMNRAWETMRREETKLKGEEGIFFSRQVIMSEKAKKDIENNAINAANPELAYHKSSDFKSRLKEALESDMNWFVKYFYNPFFKGQKIPQWKRAVDISEERRETRLELNEKYFTMTKDFYGMQGESLDKIEKILIEGDATLPYKHKDMLSEAARLKREGNIEGAEELREKARNLRKLNRYSDEELKEGITMENGEKVSLNDKEIEIYKSIRTMLDQMHNDWYVHQMNTLLRPYRNEKWFTPFMDIYSQRDSTPEMQKLWKTINRYAFDNYTGKKETTIEKKRNADREALQSYFGLENIDGMAKAYKENYSAMNKIRKARNRLGQWIAYFPRVRPKGKYYINVYEITKEMKNDKEVEKKTLLFNTTFNNAAEGESIEREVKEELKGRNITVELGRVTKESEQSFIGASDRNLQRLLDNAIARLKVAKNVDKTVLENIKDAMVETISNELKSRAFGRYAIRRRWRLIKGYETTGLQKILRDYITGFTGMFTKQAAAVDFLELLKGIGRKQTNLYEDISKYAKDMLRNQETMDRVSGKARGFGFIWFLGANIRPVVLQITQNYVTGMPFLGEKMREWGIKGMPEKYYHKAMMDAARTKFDKETGEIKGKSINQWEKRMIHEMLMKGIAQDQYVQEITGRMQGKFRQAYAKTLYYLSYPFSQLEIFNRKSAGLAMFRLAWEYYSNIKNEEERYGKAFEEAREYIYKTHYAYGKENLPRWAAGGDIASVGARTAMTFRSFTHNYLLSLVNSGDWKTIAHSFAYLAAFGGLLGLPIIKDLLELITRWTGKDYTKSAREIMRKFGGRTLEVLGMHGLPALAGANISGSMAIGIPFVGTTPSDTVYGAIGGLFTKGQLAIESLKRGDIYRMAENVAPEFVGNPMKAYRMATIGATTQRGKIIYDEYGRPVKLTGKEAVLKTVGITPTEYSARTEAQRSITNVKEYFQDWHEDIYESYRIARLNHDNRAINNALKEIKQYNRAIRDKGAQSIVSPIKLSNLMKAAKTSPTKQKLRETRYERSYF